MATRVAELTTDQLRDLIGTTVEQKLLELLGDPDDGLVLTRKLRDRLIRQQKSVAKGERGEPLEDVIGRLGLV